MATILHALNANVVRLKQAAQGRSVRFAELERVTA